MPASALDSVLDALHVSASVVLRRVHVTPWAIDVPDATTLGAMLGVGREVTAVAFHLVRSGRLQLDTEGQAPLLVNAGQMVLAAGGQAHRMGDGAGAVPVPFQALLGAPCEVPHSTDRADPTDSADTPLAGSDVLCGVFMLRSAAHNPLTATLPALLRVSLADTSGGALMRLLMAELDVPRPGRAYATGRLLELLYAEAVRQRVAASDARDRGFLAAIGDSRIGAVLDLIHGALDAPLSVDTMASAAGLSPSRFAARFRDLLGTSPMAYATAWRLDRAAERLREGDTAVEQVARSFGYASVPAFTRAFSRRHGTSPGRLRRAARAAPD